MSQTQAQDASAYIYQGFWIDWSKGKVRGGTVTLSPANSIILVAILAIFVQVTGSQLWKVFQLALHQFRATQELRDGLYHQQQAVLRNDTSDFSSIWQLIKIGFAWRHQRTINPLKRSFTLVTWALLHFVLFALAGIFSSPLVDAGDTVLSRSPFCGKFNDTYFSSMGSHSKPGMPDHLENEYYAHYQARCQESQEYAGSCYSNIESLAKCNSMATTRLSWNTTTQQTCPFDSSVCLANVPSVIYDTGFLSSHQDLGLNAQEQDRIWYRKRTTCTILNDARFVSDWKNISATANSPAKRVVDAYYGPNPLADRNATYSYSDWDQYYSFDQYSDTNPYQINAPYAAAGDTNDLTSNFVPIPELARADADTTLVFLSFSKFYETAVDDPWFSAQEAVPYPARSNQNNTGTIFKRDRPLTTLGCAEQHQICTAGNASSSSSSSSRPGNCTPMLGWLQIEEDPNGFASLNLTSKQQSTFHRVFQAAIESVFPAIIQQLAQRDPPLLARRQIQGIVGLGLPDNQWQLETEYWHAIAMAHLQRTVVAYGTGEFAANTAYINVSTDPSDKWLCQNLIISGTSYHSFNLFALIFILVLGLLIVVAGATIEDVVTWAQQKLGRGVSRHESWTANGLLVMQSLLYERDGCGVWSRYHGIPVCGPGGMMGVPERRRGQQQHQQHQHKDSGDTSGSSFETHGLELQVAMKSLRAGLTNQSAAEYQVLEDADVADRMSYPPLGWGILPPPGTAL